MKKLVFLILFPILIFGQTYTLVDSLHTTLGSSPNLIGFTSRNYWGARYIVGATYTQIGKIAIYTQKHTGDTPVQDFVIQIWSNDSNNPLSQIGTNSNTINATNFPAFGSPDWKEFTFSTPVTHGASIGDTLWIVVYTADDAADVCDWLDNNISGTLNKYDADGIGEWTSAVDDKVGCRIYSFTPSQKKYFHYSNYPKSKGY
jgi:hypothetical protein